MKIFNLFFLSFSILVLTNCSSKKDITNLTTESNGAPVVLHGNWVKDKDEKFDLAIKARNKSDKNILIYPDDFKCGKGDEYGFVKFKGFSDCEGVSNMGVCMGKRHKKDEPYTLQPNQTMSFMIVCDLDRHVKSKEMFLEIKNIFENTSKDAVEKGASIAQNLKLVVPSKK